MFQHKLCPLLPIAAGLLRCWNRSRRCRDRSGTRQWSGM